MLYYKILCSITLFGFIFGMIAGAAGFETAAGVLILCSFIAFLLMMIDFIWS